MRTLKGYLEWQAHTDRTQTEQKADSSQRLAGSRTQPSIVTDAHQATWENVKEPAADEFPGFERLDFPPVVGTVLISQLNMAVFVIAEQARLVKRGFFDIGCQITQGTATTAGSLALDNPVR